VSAIYNNFKSIITINFIGGVISNMVHGGSSTSGFIYEDVTALLVMTADAKIKVVNTVNDLNNWKCSAGLLGIILAVEFRLIKDNGIQMMNKVDIFSPPKTDDTAAIITFLTNVTTVVYTMVARSNHVEFFYDAYSSKLVSLYSVDSGVPFPNPADPAGNAVKKATYQAG
jgi:FAD/FMN-containing dehydrogenase